MFVGTMTIGDPGTALTPQQATVKTAIEQFILQTLDTTHEQHDTERNECVGRQAPDVFSAFTRQM